MKIFEQVKRFDAHTGKPYFVKKFKEFRCDFSGEVIDEDLESYSYPSYNLEYGDQDPCFGSCGKEYEFGKTHDINMFEFLSDTYHFRNDTNDQCVAMMLKYHKSKMSFAEMCRTSRIEAAETLIKSGEITAEQLYED